MVHIFSDYDTNPENQVLSDKELTMDEILIIRNSLSSMRDRNPRKDLSSERQKFYDDLIKKFDYLLEIEMENPNW